MPMHISSVSHRGYKPRRAGAEQKIKVLSVRLLLRFGDILIYQKKATVEIKCYRLKRFLSNIFMMSKRF